MGYTATTFTVSTRDVLKVQFVPGKNTVRSANRNYTGYTPYSKLAVFVSVEGSDQATTLLNNGLDGNAVQKSAVLNFSDAFTNNCASTDTTCRNSVTITVYKPNYDFFQWNYGTYCFAPPSAPAYCADHTQVVDGHEWEGTLFVQTNDTKAL